MCVGGQGHRAGRGADVGRGRGSNLERLGIRIYLKSNAVIKMRGLSMDSPVSARREDVFSFVTSFNGI